MKTGLNILTKLLENNEATRPNLADKHDGIKTPFWFWGSDRYHKLLFKDPKEAKSEEIPEPPKAMDVIPDSAKVDNEINQILAKHPEMSGATFFNLLKSKGYKLELPEGMQDMKKECDDAGAFPQVTRAKESATFKDIGFRARLVESSASDNGIGFTRFKAILLQEGMGNMKDAFYYSKEALESAVPVFEGKKIFADHPTDVEEQIRPERSVKDVLGHFEKVHTEEGEGGQTLLMADVVILPDKPYEWARALMRHAVDYAKTYPDKSFIGLSINASGDADEIGIDQLMASGVPESAIVKLQKAKDNGIESVRVVSTIQDAVSCDLVTEAGAGGKVIEMLENERKISMSKKNKSMEAKVQEALKHAQGAEAEEAEETEENEVVPKDDKKDSEVPEKKEGEAESEENEALDPEHADEEQDVALIKKLLKDYVGGEEEPSEEECNIAKEAYGAAKEMGMEGEEALKCAGYSMKMAKHMAAKQAKKESEEKCESEEKKESEETIQAEKKETKAKESAESIKLAGENAKLKEQIFALQKEKEIEKMLQESGLPRAATKVIRAKLEESKTLAEVKMKFELFKEGYGVSGGKATITEGLFVQPEKQTTSTKGGLNLSECLIK